MTTTNYDTVQRAGETRQESTGTTGNRAIVVAVIVALLLAGAGVVAARTGDSGGGGGITDTSVSDAEPASRTDLLIAAHWARYLEAVGPDLFPPEGDRATYEDLVRAATYAPR